MPQQKPSALSLKSLRRYLVMAFIGLGIFNGVTRWIEGIVGLAIAPTYLLLLVSSFALGFFLVLVNPIGTQYASETALPTPEGTSNGLISLAGQISVVLVYIMEPLRKATGS